jgi:DNA polymerase-3 subunit gamma/tau
VAAQDAAAALTLVSEVASVGADLRRFTAELLEQFRGLFLVQYAPNVEEIVDEPADVVAEWRSLSSKVGAADVLRCIDLLGAALSDLRDGREERLIVELTLLKMSRPETSPDIQSVISRLDRLEERTKRGVPPTVPPDHPKPVDAPASPSNLEPSERPLEVKVTANGDGEATAAAGSAEAVPSPESELSPAADLDLSAFIDKWPMVVTRVREEAGPRRFAVFRDAKPVRVDGLKLVITVPGPFHRDQLIEDRELADVVAAALADVAGGKVGFTYEADGNAPVAAAPVVPTVNEQAPDKNDLVESDEGAIDPTALVVDLLGGEVVEQ